MKPKIKFDPFWKRWVACEVNAHGEYRRVMADTPRDAWILFVWWLKERELIEEINQLKGLKSVSTL